MARAVRAPSVSHAGPASVGDALHETARDVGVVERDLAADAGAAHGDVAVVGEARRRAGDRLEAR